MKSVMICGALILAICGFGFMIQKQVSEITSRLARPRDVVLNPA